MNTTLLLAKAALQEGVTCALVTPTGDVHTAQTPGISPLMTWLETQPALLRGSAVADRVVGKAAALLMVLGGVAEVYSPVVSAPALACLNAHRIPCTYDMLTPRIQNRAGDGLCPMESVTLDIDDPAAAPVILAEALTSLRKGINP